MDPADAVTVAAPALLELVGVSAAYVRRTILREVDLRVGPAEIVALLGPNGAGKSTVLKAVCGLAPITAGAVQFGGEAITGRRPAECLRRGIAYLPQGGQVFGPLTVADNLTVAAAAWPPGSVTADARQAALQRFPDLAGHERQRAGTLSGGQKQQLAIAMALLAQPRLLLVDEPSIGLAPRLARAAVEQVRATRDATGAAVLLVEQNVPLALEVADRCVLLVNGRLVASASTAHLRADPALRRQFTFGLETVDAA
ncbi:MAG: ABC transporter ATP-binding protein [Fimbriimonadaceae bacterium]|nr:ABC transporter ATP-binding protein [Fimbriimonadaceae bacterium]